LDATYTAANAAIPRAGAAAGRIGSYIVEQVLSLLENGHDPLPNKPADRREIQRLRCGELVYLSYLPEIAGTVGDMN
jgi:hypothetical protein